LFEERKERWTTMSKQQLMAVISEELSKGPQPDLVELQKMLKQVSPRTFQQFWKSVRKDETIYWPELTRRLQKMNSWQIVRAPAVGGLHIIIASAPFPGGFMIVARHFTARTHVNRSDFTFLLLQETGRIHKLYSTRA
jgi:hypothetical protein